MTLFKYEIVNRALLLTPLQDFYGTLEAVDQLQLTVILTALSPGNHEYDSYIQ